MHPPGQAEELNNMAQALPTRILETARTLLRPLRPEDSEAMYEIYSDPETMEYWSSQPVKSIEGARKLVQADVDWEASGLSGNKAAQVSDPD